MLHLLRVDPKPTRATPARNALVFHSQFGHGLFSWCSFHRGILSRLRVALHATHAAVVIRWPHPGQRHGSTSATTMSCSGGARRVRLILTTVDRLTSYNCAISMWDNCAWVIALAIASRVELSNLRWANLICCFRGCGIVPFFGEIFFDVFEGLIPCGHLFVQLNGGGNQCAFSLCFHV